MMDVSEAIKHLHAATSMSPSSITEEDRQKMLKACEALRMSLESPMELAMRVLFSVTPLVSTATTTVSADNTLSPIRRPRFD